jgi:uncharacterized protein
MRSIQVYRPLSGHPLALPIMIPRSFVRAAASARVVPFALGLGFAAAVATVMAAPLSAAPVASSRALTGAPVAWHVDAAASVAQQFAQASPSPLRTGVQAAFAVRGAALQDSPPIDWRVLAGLDYLTGKATDTLKALNGKRVRVPGFVVPLDDFMEDGAEFLLVPYYGACVHTPPPPPNQIIFVQMANKKAVKLALFDAIWMHGTLKIATVESPYGTVGFTIDGLKMEPYSSK